MVALLIFAGFCIKMKCVMRTGIPKGMTPTMLSTEQLVQIQA